MPSEKPPLNNIAIQQTFQHLSLGTLCKSIAISGLLLFLFYTFLFNHPYYQSTNKFTLLKPKLPLSIPPNDDINTPTRLDHIVFGTVSTIKSWQHKKPYIESWWRPNLTRGYLFLDGPPTKQFQPWPTTSPPFRINQEINKFKFFPKNNVIPFQVRILHTILEIFKEGDKNVRWYVMTDDDTILFIDNLVQILNNYDHTKFYYIGTHSENVKSNSDLSFDMAFGGAGYALSYPLVEALTSILDGCIERYPNLYSSGSDFTLHTCLADLGVSLTHERGFHQIDLRGDISGLLSAHPLSPILSLHHIDAINPIFPSMNRYTSIEHLMNAAKVDQSRLLQQTICYKRENNWTFSISWGYSTYVYENIYPRSVLTRPIQTFKPWLGNYKPPFYIFNTRSISNNPCEAPHKFFFDSIGTNSGNYQTVTTYARASPRNLPPCALSGNHSADPISKVIVFSPATTPKEAGVMECCDIEQLKDMNVAHVTLRACTKDEIIA